MWVGDVLADRFVLRRPIGKGGMATVFLAEDRASGEDVAIKVMDLGDDETADRFRREARILADLSHPGIVRYVMHGQTEGGESFLAMEWLDGETLADRLRSGSLTAEQSLAVVRGASEALALAHLKGVVHRDVKPSNLFLCGAKTDRVKILDFGIARSHAHSRALTHTGTLIGTVGYMAPEQALGTSEIDARADVFALGCVLFECLTGQPPFHAKHAVAVLAKLLRADPPRVNELRPGLGASLDALVGRLLAKNRDERPADAAEVLQALKSHGDCAAQGSYAASESPITLTTAEQRVVSVILAESSAGDSGQAATQHASGRGDEQMILLAKRFGAEALALTDSAWLILLSGKGAATDRASQAARCALALCKRSGDLRLALATGRAATAGRLPVGPAIDRAAALLRSTATGEEPGIVIDDLTAGLLSSRFEVREAASSHVLVAERPDGETPRLLLGKPTPCIGREKELAILDAILNECLGEPVARAALLTGPAGIGKSRVRVEFVRQVRDAHQMTVLTARADPTQAGSSFALVRQLVGHAAGLTERSTQDEARSKLRAHLSGRFDGEGLDRVAEFLSELIGAPLEGPVSPLLRASRDDSRIMSTWMRRAFEEWVAAECDGGPLLLSIDDLQWGDGASLDYLAQAFRKLSDRPLMLLASARVEQGTTFPEPVKGITWHEVALGGLTAKSAKRLVSAVLGSDVQSEIVERVVRLADGNAFYLEELIRAVAGGRTEGLPDTVVAMAQARLDGLSPDARRILRAASIFGEVFPDVAVATLLGDSFTEEELGEWFRTLVDLELLSASSDEARHGAGIWTFRHGLLRETAYASLTAADCENGHRLAAEWLVRNDRKDALVIAEHFARGARPAEALPWWLLAAETALNAGHQDLALATAQQGLELARDELKGRFLEVQQTALTLRGEWARALESGDEAMDLLGIGTTPWLRAAGSRIVSAIYLGRPATVLDVLRRGANLPAPAPSGPFGLASLMIVSSLLHAGARGMALSFAERVEAAAQSGAPLDPVFTGWRHTIRALMNIFAHDRIAPGIAHGMTAIQSFDDAADFVGWAVGAMYHGIAYVEAGAFDRARESLSRVAEQNEAMLLHVADFARYYLARMEALSGETAAAQALLSSPPGVADGARAFLAEAHFRNGDLARAEEDARLAEKSSSCYARVTALAVLGRVELAHSRPERAITLFDSGIAQQDAGSGVPFWRSILLLGRAEAMMASGDEGTARRAITEARDRLVRIAEEFTDETLRTTYLAVPEHQRTFELAEKWQRAADK